MHKHKCPACGHIWEHTNSCAGDVDAHTCEKCGTESWRRHYDSFSEELEDFKQFLQELPEDQ